MNSGIALGFLGPWQIVRLRETSMTGFGETGRNLRWKTKCVYCVHYTRGSKKVEDISNGSPREYMYVEEAFTRSLVNLESVIG